MENAPHCFRILNGIRAALKAAEGEDQRIEEWLGRLAQSDHHDGSNRLFALPAETVSNVVEGLEGTLLTLSLGEQSDLLAANQFFKAIVFLREYSLCWASEMSPAEIAM